MKWIRDKLSSHIGHSTRHCDYLPNDWHEYDRPCRYCQFNPNAHGTTCWHHPPDCWRNCRFQKHNERKGHKSNVFHH